MSDFFWRKPVVVTATLSVANGQAVNWSARLTDQYVMDIINHVAAVHVDFPLVYRKQAAESLERFLAWEQSQLTDQIEFGYCNFAAFVAFELARGGLSQNQSFHQRVCIAVDFIAHVLLENNLMNNVWRVEYEPSNVVAILVAPKGSPEQILRAFRTSRWKPSNSFTPDAA
jgi:hypothetical protein